MPSACAAKRMVAAIRWPDTAAMRIPASGWVTYQ